MRWSIVAVSAAIVVVAGCSGEDIAEQAIEEQLEAQGDGSIDVDIDDGQIKVETPDGSAVFNADEDGDGGQMVIDGSDGQAVIGTGQDLPDDFPSEVPVPDGLEIAFSTSSDTGQGKAFVIGGEVAGEVGDVAEAYMAQLESAGFAQQQQASTPEGAYFTYSNGTYVVSANIGVASEASSAGVSIAVAPATG